MTPTLAGRIQTRILLFIVLGLPITLIYALAVNDFIWFWPRMEVFFRFIATVFLIGLILDPVYIFLQTLRWDRDWPFAYQFFFSIVEFGIALALAANGLIPWLDSFDFDDGPEIWTAIWHFTVVFIPMFLALLGPLSVFFIRWRFKAAQFGKI
ncbi:hypothetical protein HKCCE2091_06355 [Rhodobacterales bacterium HKCCE2091]|nr:hypothetical protein [Rhodobacterales bacterium HKCCE2091]